MNANAMAEKVTIIEEEQFSFLLTEGKEWYSPKEVGAMVGRSDQFIRDLFDNQKILGHQANGRAGRGRAQRYNYQIHRDGVILYLMETANYEAADFIERLGEVFRRRSMTQLSRIRELLDEAVQFQTSKGLLLWQ